MATLAEIKKKGVYAGEIILAIHEIGEYAFVETEAKDLSTRFIIFRDEKNIGYATNSLEMAMVVAIAEKYDGRNSRAAHYFALMIGLDKTDDQKA